MNDRNAGGPNIAQGETEGPEQEPRQVGDADPAVRDPRPDGPMNQPVDPDPVAAFEGLKDHVAFYPSKMDGCWVGGQKVEAQEGDFYGGWITPNIVGGLAPLTGWK